MNAKKFIKIFVNIALFICFLLTYFLDCTGLDLHQYLGVAAAGFLLVHFFNHLEWIKNVSKRFLKNISNRIKIYYLLDGFLLIAIIVITLTGILISTWLNDFISDYLMWRTIHILSSIVGLLLLILKTGLHWKFFVKILAPINRQNGKGLASTHMYSFEKGTDIYSRREAIKTIGIISAVGVFGLFKAASAFTIPEAIPLPEPDQGGIIPDLDGENTILEPTAAPLLPEESIISQVNEDENGQRRSRRRGSTTLETPAAAVPGQQPQPTPQIFEGQQQADDQPVTDCIIRCDKGCAYPGLCRRYMDQNQNQLCDLGECLPN